MRKEGDQAKNLILGFNDIGKKLRGLVNQLSSELIIFENLSIAVLIFYGRKHL